MRNRVALMACTLILAGCGGADKTQELQQQKMTLDLMKSQTEQIAALMKNQKEQFAALKQKEEDLQALEKKNQETLQDIEGQKALLAKLQGQISEDTLKLKAEGERLQAERERVLADEVKNQQARQEITTDRAEVNRKLAAINEREEAERRAQEPERRAQEEKRRQEEQKRQQETADRIKRREPFLTELATKLADNFGKATKAPASTERRVLLQKLTSPMVAGFEEDDVFVSSVKRAVLEWDKGHRDSFREAKLYSYVPPVLAPLADFEKSYLNRNSGRTLGNENREGR